MRSVHRPSVGLVTHHDPLALVLGATGKTGSRVAAQLPSHGVAVRTAARSGADVAFDWNVPATHRPALAGVDRVYLLAPTLRIDFADAVRAFLDLAEAAGVRHVTYLSAYGMEAAPREVAARAVELDLLSRPGIEHSILRPAWFMQDFSETFLQPVDGAIVVPTGDGTEAFIDADDIAAVAALTLAQPSAHAGREYALTGPDALSVADAARVISEATGHTVRHVDPDRDTWLDAVISTGVPRAYAAVLRPLTETVASGLGSVPNGVVEEITGRPPRSAQRTTAAWTQPVDR